MAGANKRTRGMLMVLGLLFIATIVIICLTYDSDQPQQSFKSRPLSWDVLTNTAPPTTTTTTTTTSTTTTTTTTSTPPTTTTTTPTTTTTTTTTPATTTTPTTTTTPSTATTDVPSTSREPSPSTPPSPPTSAITTTPDSPPPLTSTTTTQSPQPQPDESRTTTQISTTTPPTPSPTTMTPESSSITESSPLSTQESTNTTSEATTPTTEPYDKTSTITANTSESTTGSPSCTSPAPIPYPQPTASKSANVCMTAACKTLAARMLDMMDHSITRPCEDFYQYACGGVMDDLFLDPENPQKETRHFIMEHLKSLSPEDPELGPLKVFYDSCTAAEVESRNRTFWLSNINAALDTVDSIGPWLAEESGSADDSLISITQILVGMMKIDFAPFFDLLLDVSEDGTDRFVLKLTPPVLLSPFSKDMGWAVCYSEHLNRTLEALGSPSSSYDLNEDYEKYLECIREGTGLHARLAQMTRAVKELGLMHHFNNTNHKQGAEGQLVDSLMDTEFLLIDMSKALPSKSKLREAHLKKDFKNVTLSYLEDKFNFPMFKVEWVALVEGLFGHAVDPDNVTIHVYFDDDLHAALDEIDFIGDVIKLRRIMLILLAERLYTDLVEPAQHALGKLEYCLRVTTELLGDFVSTLYLKNLPRLQERQQKMKEVIKANKEAAEQELLHQPELKPEEMEMWLSKLRSMSGEMASPEPSHYLLPGINETTLSDNFIDNSLILLTRHRSLMYQHFLSSISSPAVLWSHFLKPFSQFGISLYAPNKFLIPYGAMEAPFFFWDVPDYINYAGIGHMIAHELIHGFDETGIRYNGTQRQILEGYNYLIELSECLSEQYRAPQSLEAASGLLANFTLERLPLNEVLAGSGAVRLAWEAYELFRSQKDKGKGTPTMYTVPDAPQLPWLDLNPQQLYFLRIAQVHCSATSDIHMLPLMEKEHLPSRLWVKLVLQNEPLFTEAFSCSTPLHRQCPYILGSVPAPSTP